MSTPEAPSSVLPPSPWSKPGYRPTTIVPGIKTLAGGSEDRFTVDFDVEMWMVAVLPAASVSVVWYPGSGSGGFGYPMFGGGNGKIGGNGNELVVRNIGANPATILAVAIVNASWFTYDPGDLA